MRLHTRVLLFAAILPGCAFAQPQSGAYALGYTMGQQVGHAVRIAWPFVALALLAAAILLGWRFVSRRRRPRPPAMQ